MSRSAFASHQSNTALFSFYQELLQPQQESELNKYLIKKHSEDSNENLFVDEAQKLRASHLELLETLLNFETGKKKLIQNVIGAQLELGQKLADPSKKALRSRIFAPSILDRLSLDPWTPDETQQMFHFRCGNTGHP